MKKITTTIAALAVAGVAHMASAQVIPPNPTTIGLILQNWNAAHTVLLGSGAGILQAGGAWTFNGAVGTYTSVTVQPAATGQLFAGGASPNMDLDVSTPGGTGLLYVFFTEGIFGPSSGSYSLSLTGTSGVTAFGYMNSTLLTGGTINSGNSTYYLTLEDVISGQSESSDATLTVSAVPEANTIAAGALMLLPLGIGAIRAIRKERVA
jgi:hypothetical protein